MFVLARRITLVHCVKSFSMSKLTTIINLSVLVAVVIGLRW